MTEEAIEPTQVWTVLEWQEQHPWRDMPKSDLRDQFKTEAVALMYAIEREEFRLKYGKLHEYWGGGRMPQPGDRVIVDMEL